MTDEELDAQGVDLIRDYPLMVTGWHPEYHTAAMLDALELCRAGGGNLCISAATASLAHRPLVRAALGDGDPRTESGIRAWAAEPGENYNQFDGAYGGLGGTTDGRRKPWPRSASG